MDDLKGIIIGAVIIFALATAGISMISIVAKENPGVLENVSKTYASFNNTITLMGQDIDDMSTKINSTLSTEADEGDWGFIDSFANAVITTSQNVGRSVRLMTSFFTHLDDWLGIPAWVGNAIITVIIIIIGLAVWKIILAVV